MSIKRLLLPWLLLLLLVVACQQKEKDKPVATTPTKGSYAYDLAFLRAHEKSMLELVNEDSTARVLLSPAWQGRVMTSTATGDTGSSFGWLNYQLLSATEKKKQFNPVGGEERFWVGPEGGQFAFYFKKGDSFNIAHWQVPSIIDTMPYAIVSAGKSMAAFTANAALQNYSGAPFTFRIDRTITLLTKDQLMQKLGVPLNNGVHCVAYQTMNTITNTGTTDWKKETGLISIWLLGMFTPSPQTTVIIPFHPIPEARNLITDNYFGKVPAERLKVGDSILFFTCDGTLRSKIGLSPLIAKPIATSFDFTHNTLTIVIPEVVPGAPYVNSKWELQREPYKGDVINSYNDGPLADGTQMGPFYEVESSSMAWALQKGQSGFYRQLTCHLQGDYLSLKAIAKQLTGADLDQLKP